MGKQRLITKWPDPNRRGSFRTGGSGAVERKMDLSYYGSSEGILGLGSWVGQNNLTRKTERLDCWDLLT